MRRSRLIAASLALSLMTAGAVARELPLPSGPVAPAAQALRPGDFLWADEVSPQGPVTIIVSLAVQRAYVYRNGVLIGISTVSTGKAGHETPTGVFTILQKEKEHYSNLYNSAPMPYMQRLTWDGIALHAGTLPGHPASHGCIRLPDAFAEKLFGVTSLGITVIVTDSADVPRLALDGQQAPPISASGAAIAGDAPVSGPAAVWRPWLQREGPISLILSAADRQMRVVRNGVEIGRAPVRLGRDVTQTEVYQLVAADVAADKFTWMGVPLHGPGDGAVVSAAERNQLVLPADFRRDLAGILVPGTTIVVTPDSLQAGAFDRTIQIVAPMSGEGSQ